MNIARKIPALRKQRGLSQEALAERLHVSRQTVSRWENATVTPDAGNLLELSRALGVTSDYLLSNDFAAIDGEGGEDAADATDSTGGETVNHGEDDADKKRVLHLNLTKLAIIAQTAFLHAAMLPLGTTGAPHSGVELLVKLVPLVAASAWMAHNLRYEADPWQRRTNTFIELGYCAVQAGVFCFGYFSGLYLAATVLMVAVALVYLLAINPRYMNRPFIKRRERQDVAKVQDRHHVKKSFPPTCRGIKEVAMGAICILLIVALVQILRLVCGINVPSAISVGMGIIVVAIAIYRVLRSER